MQVTRPCVTCGVTFTGRNRECSPCRWAAVKARPCIQCGAPQGTPGKTASEFGLCLPCRRASRVDGKRAPPRMSPVREAVRTIGATAVAHAIGASIEEVHAWFGARVAPEPYAERINDLVDGFRARGARGVGR